MQTQRIMEKTAVTVTKMVILEEIVHKERRINKVDQMADHQQVMVMVITL